MLLFSKKHKTPVSTYTDSYRPPHSVKKTYHEQKLQQLWKENKFVTQGLTMHWVQNPASQSQTEQVSLHECFRNSIAASWPEKYWLARSEEKYNPVFVHEDRYISWRKSPHNSIAWNKHSSYLPLLRKETKTEMFLHNIPGPCVPKPSCLNQFDRNVVTDTLRRLSCCPSPSLQPLYTVTVRGPFQGYYSPCSGRHYCLQGMDSYADGASAIRSHVYTLSERAEYPVLQLQPQSDVMYICTSPPAILSVREP